MDRVFIKNYNPAGTGRLGREYRGAAFPRPPALPPHICQACSVVGRMQRSQQDVSGADGVRHPPGMPYAFWRSGSPATGTRKYLWELPDGLTVESVLIPDAPRCTLCISSQVGCALGCKFCLTGTMGFKRNLTVAEIVDQVCQTMHHLDSGSRITNLVFMGMGEPLANYDAVVRAIRVFIDPEGMAFSHRKITLSTAGAGTPRWLDWGRKAPLTLPSAFTRRMMSYAAHSCP